MFLLGILGFGEPKIFDSTESSCNTDILDGIEMGRFCFSILFTDTVMKRTKEQRQCRKFNYLLPTINSASIHSMSSIEKLHALSKKKKDPKL